MNAQILQLEELSANAWPAAEVEELGGWRLRHTNGVTRRANSVWPNCWDDNNVGVSIVDDRIAYVEQFYRERGLPPRYQICSAAQPKDLVQRLTERGYTTDAYTCVQIATNPTILQRSATVLAPRAYEIQIYMPDQAGPYCKSGSKTAHDEFYKTWYTTYCQAEQLDDEQAAIRSTIIDRITLQPGVKTGFALLSIKDEPVALGLGVVEREWLGIFNMATHPKFRRRGAARTIMHSLIPWAQEQGATQTYLQVMAENKPALALYESLGFETLYRYFYCTGVL